MLRDEQTTIEQLRSTLLDPVPTSKVIADAYGRLVSLARAEGIRLRRLQREPVFGRLVRELYAMERALAGTGDRATILAVDTRLRTTHKQRLDGLLATGPRCHLGAAKIQGWISAIQAEYAAKGRPWTVPALQMSDPCLAFPIDESALFQIFANLLRNAEAAVEGMESPKIQVALVHASDFTGQPLVRLEISDNAPGEVREEAIEAQSPNGSLVEGFDSSSPSTAQSCSFTCSDYQPIAGVLLDLDFRRTDDSLLVGGDGRPFSGTSREERARIVANQGIAILAVSPSRALFK